MKRRWNNDLRELGAPRPSEHLRVMYGGAKRTAFYGGMHHPQKDGQYALLNYKQVGYKTELFRKQGGVACVNQWDLENTFS